MKMSEKREELIKQLITNQHTTVKEGETLGATARRIFYEQKQRYYYLADKNPDYVQHERMYEEIFSAGFREGANWFCWKLTGKCLLEVMELK